MRNLTKTVAALASAGVVATMAVAATAPAVGVVASDPGTSRTQATAESKVATQADRVYRFRNRMIDTRCLDGNNGADGVPCANIPNQRWRLHIWNDGTRRLQNVANGDCLEAHVGTNAILLRDCNRSEAQSWWRKRFASGAVQYRNERTETTCLDYSLSYGLRHIGCHGPTNPYLRYQTWMPLRVS